MTRSMSIFGAALCLVALLAACAVGPSISGFGPAFSPQGVSVTVRLADAEFRGAELLEVGDSSVLVLTNRRELVRIYYGSMRVFEVPHGPVLHRGSSPRSEYIARWRALSRFPQGLAQAQLDTLASLYGQPRVEVRR